MPITQNNDKSISLSFGNDRYINLRINQEGSLELEVYVWNYWSQEIDQFLRKYGIFAVRKEISGFDYDFFTSFRVTDDIEEAISKLSHYLTSEDHTALVKEYNKFNSSPLLKKSERKQHEGIHEMEASKRFILELSEFSGHLDSVKGLIALNSSYNLTSSFGDEVREAISKAEKMSLQLDETRKDGTLAKRQYLYQLQKQFKALNSEYVALDNITQLLKMRAEHHAPVDLLTSEDPTKGLLPIRRKHLDGILTDLKKAIERVFNMPYQEFEQSHLNPLSIEISLSWVEAYALKEKTPRLIIKAQLQDARNKLAELKLLNKIAEQFNVLKNEGADVTHLTSLVQLNHSKEHKKEKIQTSSINYSSLSSSSIAVQIQSSGGSPVYSSLRRLNIPKEPEGLILEESTENSEESDNEQSNMKKGVGRISLFEYQKRSGLEKTTGIKVALTNNFGYVTK